MFITWNLLGLLHGFFPKWFGVGGKDQTHHTTLLHEWSWPTFWCRRKRGQQMQKGVGSQSSPRQNHHSQQESKRLREWKWNHSKHLKTNQGDSVAQTWVTNGYGLMEPYVFHSCILGEQYFWHLLTFDPNGCYIILCPNFWYRPRGFNARKQCWSARQTCHVRAYGYIWTCLWHLPCTLRENATVIHLCMKSPCTTGSLGAVLGTYWIPKRSCKCLVTITYIL